jgi:hypothetical protein
VQTLEVSHRVILDEVAKKLPIIDLRFETFYRYVGFFSNVYGSVPDINIPVEIHHVFTSSGLEYNTFQAAEEKAAESMIRSLERTFNFETKDLNWWNMRRFNRDSYNSCSGWRREKEENQQLRMKVDELTKGWRRTLERVDRMHDEIGFARSTALQDCEPETIEQSYEEISNSSFAAVNYGIVEFEETAGKY